MTNVKISQDECSLEMLKKDCIACTKCSIGGQKPVDEESCGNVFSNMNMDAGIMVIGQNPGIDEVKAAEPFVGVSGKVFNEALKRVVGVERDNLYITNVVKCYLPDNRKPSQFEIDNCRTHLDAEVALLKPKVAVALGSFAFKAMTGMSGIMKHCGEAVFSPRYGIPVIAMLHPSPYNMNNTERREMFENALRKLAEVLNGG